MDQLDVIQRLRDGGRRFIIVTIVEVTGSAPRKPGSRMIVPKEGDAIGSIGGGALENQVLKDARKIFQGPETLRKTYDLTTELAMCCGGKVEIFFERITPQDQLYIFGAGHVAQPLCTMATQAQFQVTVIDERDDYPTGERFPDAHRRLVLPPEDLPSQLQFHNDVWMVICTHDHAKDQTILEKVITKKARYLGMIGSRAKAAKTRGRLKSAGFDEDAIARLHCPVGLNIGSHAPGEIAVSVLAELISLRHGRNLDRGWKKGARPK